MKCPYCEEEIEQMDVAIEAVSRWSLDHKGDWTHVGLEELDDEMTFKCPMCSNILTTDQDDAYDMLGIRDQEKEKDA